MSAADRLAKFGRNLFDADGGKIFCRHCNVIVDHFWKDSVTEHVNLKVLVSSILWYFIHMLNEPIKQAKPEQYFSLYVKIQSIQFSIKWTIIVICSPQNLERPISLVFKALLS